MLILIDIFVSTTLNGAYKNHNAFGEILHTAVGENVNEYFVMQSHKIQFATVEFEATAIEIIEQ